MATKTNKTTSRTSTSTTPATAKSTARTGTLSREEKQRMVAEQAYYLAERRGFTGGDPVADWVAAEKVVEKIIAHP